MHVKDIEAYCDFECWDAGATSDTIIGKVSLPIKNFMKEGLQNINVELFHEKSSVGFIEIRSKFHKDDSPEIESALKATI